MPNWNKANLRSQYNRIKKNSFYKLLSDAAKKYGLPVAYVLAVASRETNCNNMLGDGNNGIGIIQIDIRWHKIAAEAKRTGSWRTNPKPLVEYGVQMLKNNSIAATAHFGDKPWFSLTSALKIAASGYNSGLTRALKAAGEGDSDKYTTGRDYGKDVMKRMVVFQEFLDEEN